MRQIELEWVPLGISVTADLDEQANEPLAELLWAKLPYNSLQNHALVSGLHLYHLVPHPELIYSPAPYKEDRTKCPDGTVFLSQLQHVAVKYGPLTEYLPAAAIGHVVPDDIPALKEAGRACWDAAYRTKEVVEVRVRRANDSTPINGLPAPPRVERQELQRLISEIHAETEGAWIDPPQELLDIHAGRIASRAGSYDQYFSTMLFVNGEVRPLGYGAHNGLVRAMQSDTISLDVLREITPNFIKVPAEFLDYCGLNRLWDFTQRTLDALPALESKREYEALITTLALYSNCLNTWNLHLFPWDLGDRYGYSEAPASLLQL